MFPERWMKKENRAKEGKKRERYPIIYSWR